MDVTIGDGAGAPQRASRSPSKKMAACAAVLGASLLVPCLLGAGLLVPAGAASTSQATAPAATAPIAAAPAATAPSTSAPSTSAPSTSAPSTSASATSASATPAPPTTPAPSAATLPAAYQTYWLASSGGAISAFGGAPNFGTLSHAHLARPVVGIASTPTGGGYWMVASDGGVFAFGNASYDGSMGGKRLAKPVVGMAEDPSTGGYWLVASDGGVFSFDAPFLGSMGGRGLAKPVVGMASTPTGGGYWLVAADGGIFAFGSARFYGSMGARRLDQPVVGMAASRTGHGYLLVAADGGTFTFGDATYHGSLGGHRLAYPVVGIAEMFNDRGYWMTDTQGGVTPFGTAELFGTLPASRPVVGIAAAKGNGDPPPATYPPGSYGYDVSNYQCSNFPPAPHTIGVVEIDGWGDSATNPCFVTEVSWASPGVNLYMFVLYGTQAAAEPGCSAAPVPAACNFGYAEAASDFATAQVMIGARATVPWWLDLEQANWTSSTAANQSVVTGAAAALHAAGVGTVGYYFSLEGWSRLFGDYDPSGPLFPAWWGGPTPASKCSQARAVAAAAGDFVPSGPIELIQYSDDVNGFDGDYAC